MKKVIIVSLIVILICISISIITKPKIAILGYHSFTDSKSSNEFIMPIDHFEEQLKYLKTHHYHTITPDELYLLLTKKKSIPRKTVMITFDDGYQSNYDLAFPLLKKYNMKGTVFIVGKLAEEGKESYMNLETIKKIPKEYPNITVASHSYNLHVNGVTNLSKEALITDFNTMKKIISTSYFAYPYGLHDKNCEEVLKEEKYHLAFTFGPNKEHRRASHEKNLYEIPRLNITNNMPLWKFKLRLNFF